MTPAGDTAAVRCPPNAMGELIYLHVRPVIDHQLVASTTPGNKVCVRPQDWFCAAAPWTRKALHSGKTPPTWNVCPMIIAASRLWWVSLTPEEPSLQFPCAFLKKNPAFSYRMHCLSRNSQIFLFHLCSTVFKIFKLLFILVLFFPLCFYVYVKHFALHVCIKDAVQFTFMMLLFTYSCSMFVFIAPWNNLRNEANVHLSLSFFLILRYCVIKWSLFLWITKTVLSVAWR